jgi:hypothetical protein
MLRAKIDSKEVNRILGNAVSYSYGFLEGAEINQIIFNQKLGDFIVDSLYKYVDAMARGNPDALHHVYEWGQTGSEGGRLFEMKAKASKRVITITGKFLPSRSVSDGSTEPFTDKAYIMENSIQVIIEPKNAQVLAFEDEGEMVFTPVMVVVDNPGGDEVAGSFGRTVDSFFSNYLTAGMLQSSGIFDKLRNPREFADYWASGTKSGRAVGIKAGTKYMDTPAGIGME